MNKQEIIKKIENIAPQEIAQSWDCVGFMAQTDNDVISKVMICLSPTEDVISQAVSQGCDMIISHHPMFEMSLNSVLLNEKYQPKIDIYSAHTNLDLAIGGTTDTLIKIFNSYLNDNYQVITLPVQSEQDFLRYIEFKEPVKIIELASILRKISPDLRYVNNLKIETVRKIAFCAGSGSEFIKLAKDNDADCLVTGDVKFHTAIESEIVLFDIGHYCSEIVILPVLKQIIGNEVEIVYAKECDPFIYK